MLSVDFRNQAISLPVNDRLELMQAIVTSLQSDSLAAKPDAKEPSVSDYFEPGKTYEVWTPIDAPGAAQVLMDLLAADAGTSYE
jgi:hypothetical protein